ncbi:DUF1998 domain-containing protein, partial [bacterium]|nr:DUF1998 domain-containing protein [bacterium]
MGIVRSFFAGQEAVTSVLSTSLFEELPVRSVSVGRKTELLESFGFGSSSTREENSAKQFIAFSDSRQAAAYFASYFSIAYTNILYKRVISQALQNPLMTCDRTTLDQFVGYVRKELEDHAIYNTALDDDIKNVDLNKEAWKAILKEMAESGDAHSLSRLGIMAFSLNPERFKEPIRDNKQLGLSAAEVLTLFNVLIQGFLIDVAVNHDRFVHMSSSDDVSFYSYSGKTIFYSLSDSKASGRSFIPTKQGLSNKRVDYIMRALGFDFETAKKLLEAVWSIFADQKIIVPKANSAVLYQIDAQKLMVVQPASWYRCSRCQKVTPYNLRGVCPTYKCSGSLQPFEPGQYFQSDHYWRLYHDLDMRTVRVCEHTAQLSKELAYEYQNRFKNKEIDVLSCSTTFEMGVDVGDLETVFMRNVPPSPANYAQRAGRAGRRCDSAAYALTFCNRSSHDYTFFRNPLDMIKGSIAPPHFDICNDKIAIRHIYASAWAFFWKIYKNYFASVGEVISSEPGIPDGIEEFSRYLRAQPKELRQFLKAFLPDSLYMKYNCDSFGWTEQLLGSSPDSLGDLLRVKEEYCEDVKTLKKEIADRISDPKKSVDRLRHVLNHVESENILTFLARRGIMPRYGFPVDTVDLRTSVENVALQRDLGTAISEYAPGSQVVANNTLITSRYIKIMPNKGFGSEYIYKICRNENCKALNLARISERLPDFCGMCGELLEEAYEKKLLVPSYGFIAEVEHAKPGLVKPQRFYRSTPYHSSISQANGHDSSRIFQKLQLFQAEAEYLASIDDSMVILNTADFFVCGRCGYAEPCSENNRDTVIAVKHNTPFGHSCCSASKSKGRARNSERMERYSLGYRYTTDVFQLRFTQPCLDFYGQAMSVLYALLRGICSSLSIEERDINGSLDYTTNGIYTLVLFDTMPGGSGHIKRLAERPYLLERCFREAYRIVARCTCGGENQDT